MKRHASKKRAKKPSPPPFSLLIVGAVIIGTLLGLGILRFLTPTNPQIPGVAQTATNSSMEFTLTAVTELPARHAMNPNPSDNEKGLVLAIKVKNLSSGSKPFLPANQLFIKSRDGMIYQMRPVSGVNDAITAGDIPAGETLEGEVSFIVDKTAEQLRLFVDSRWDDEPPIVVALP